jgi:hypothetical protein
MLRYYLLLLLRHLLPQREAPGSLVCHLSPARQCLDGWYPLLLLVLSWLQGGLLT